jgi:hypothetical protein
MGLAGGGTAMSGVVPAQAAASGMCSIANDVASGQLQTQPVPMFGAFIQHAVGGRQQVGATRMDVAQGVHLPDLKVDVRGAAAPHRPIVRGRNRAEELHDRQDQAWFDDDG